MNETQVTRKREEQKGRRDKTFKIKQETQDLTISGSYLDYLIVTAVREKFYAEAENLRV